MLKYILKKDKKFLLMLFVIPIAVIPLLSYFFSSIYIENINYGIVNLDDSSLSRSIVQGFENHQGLNACYYTSSPEKLQDAIYSKEISGGIIIPEGYAQDIKEKKSPKAIVLVDATNLMIGNNAVGYSSAVLGTYNAGYQLKVLEGKNMLPQTATKTIGTFSLVDRTLYDPQLSYLTYIMYIVIPLIVQLFYLNSYLLPALIEEKESFDGIKITGKGIMERVRRLVPRLLLMWLTIGTSTLAGLLIANVLFGLPMRGNLLAHYVMITLFLLSLTIMGFVLISFLSSKNYHYYVEVFAIIYILFILTSGAVWPEYMMPAGFMTVVRMLWPYAYVANPMKFLYLKGIGWDILTPYIVDLLVFCLAWLVIAVCLNSILLYRKKNTLLVKGKDVVNTISTEGF